MNGLTTTTFSMSISHKLTKKGRPRARYTLKVNFTDGKTFTYRADDNLSRMIAKGYSNITEIDAIILKFVELRASGKIAQAELFDNAMPQGSDTLLKFTIGKIVICQVNHKYFPVLGLKPKPQS